MTEDIKVLMQGAPDWMRELHGVLRGVGVRAQLCSPQSVGVTNTWGTKVALVVASADVTKALTAIEDHVGRDLDPGARARAERPVDFDAAETECPACGTKFATKDQQRCPDCGLNFAG